MHMGGAAVHASGWWPMNAGEGEAQARRQAVSQCGRTDGMIHRAHDGGRPVSGCFILLFHFSVPEFDVRELTRFLYRYR